MEEWKVVDLVKSPHDVPINDHTWAYYDRVHHAEMEMREKLIARLQVPLAALLAVFGVHGYLLNAVDFAKAGWALYFFLAIGLVSVLLTAKAAQILFKVMTGHRYFAMPTLVEIENFRRASIAKFLSEPGADEWLDHWVDVTLKAELQHQCIKCASHNALVNKDRSFRSWHANNLLFAGGVATTICCAVFFIGNLKENPLHRVKIESEPGTSTKVMVVSPLTFERFAPPPIEFLDHRNVEQRQ